MRTVKAHWCRCGKNFGDLLTRYWIEKLTDVKAVWVEPEEADLFGCGSIVEAIPTGYTGIILGSGIMLGETSRPDLRSADIRALRGPLTAERIGVDVPFGDFGLLFNLFKEFLYLPDCKKVHDVGTLPHYVVKDKQDPHHHRIDIQSGVENIVREVSKCQRIVSSSLHGIILADAFGIENKWIDSKAVRGSGFKFRDYAASLGEEIKSGEWRLGNQERITDIAERLQEIVIRAVGDCDRKEEDRQTGEREGSMNIRCTNLGTRMMYVPKIEDRRVVFSKNGFATVSDRLGRYLVRTCSAIEEIKPAKKARTKAKKGRGKTIPRESE